MKIRLGFVSNSSSSSFVCNYFSSKYITYSSKNLDKVKLKLLILIDVAKQLGFINENKEFKDIFSEPRKATSKDIKILNKNWDRKFKYNKEMFFIDSIEDNSIPYQLFSLIEDIFTAERVHLG